MSTTIIVCDTCRWQPDQRRREEDGKTGGEILAEHVEAAIDGENGLQVRRHSCLNGCKRHCNLAVVARGKTSYYLTELPPTAESAADAIAFALAHESSEDGVVPKPRRPVGLDGHVMGRIPWLDLDEETRE